MTPYETVVGLGLCSHYIVLWLMVASLNGTLPTMFTFAADDDDVRPIATAHALQWDVLLKAAR